MSSMKERGIFILFSSFLFVVICLMIMAGLHERHYRNRRSVIDPKKCIEDRIAAIESILTEDRFT